MKKIFVLFQLLCYSLLINGEIIEVNGINYELNQKDESAKVVSNPYYYSGDIVIPEIIQFSGKYYYVTSIAGGEDDDYPYHGGAFEDCINLTSIIIPKTITRIGMAAFRGCTSLKSVYISDLEAWCNIYFQLQTSRWVPLVVETNPLYYAHNLYLNGEIISDLVIPENIKVIRRGAFEGGNFKSVTFHKEVETLWDFAFYECNNLTNIYNYSPGIKFENDFYLTFFSNLQATTLHIRKRYEEYYQNSYAYYHESRFRWTDFGKIEYLDGIDYQLTYNVDDEEYKKVWYEEGEPITPEVEPEKDGYKFSGWKDLPETMPNHDITVRGTFSPNIYKLTYIVDEKEYKVCELKCDSVITPESEPTRKGMTFSGWSVIPKTMPAKDITITGTFSWSKLTKDNVVYEVADTLQNYCKVIGNDNASGEVKIDSVEIDGCYYQPMQIVDKAFYGCKDINKIEISKTVTAIGERSFANIDKLTDVMCWVEEVPTTDRTAFENSYIDYVTLHVPYGSISKYKDAAPWKNFKEVVAIQGIEPQEKCVTPTVNYKDGKLVFECETDGAECVTTITSADVDTHYGNEVAISYIYNISTYAKADGYANSEVVTAMLVWIEKDDTTTGLNEEIEAKAILVQAHEGTIWISGAEQGTLIEVFDIGGTRIANIKSQQGTVQIETMLNIGDIAIVKIGKRTIKMVMK